jgi:hypothetical protein
MSRSEETAGTDGSGRARYPLLWGDLGTPRSSYRGSLVAQFHGQDPIQQNVRETRVGCEPTTSLHRPIDPVSDGRLNSTTERARLPLRIPLSIYLAQVGGRKEDYK